MKRSDGFVSWHVPVVALTLTVLVPALTLRCSSTTTTTTLSAFSAELPTSLTSLSTMSLLLTWVLFPLDTVMWYRDARILDITGILLFVFDSVLKPALAPLMLGSDDHSWWNLWRRGRRVTMQAQVIPRFASVTP